MIYGHSFVRGFYHVPTPSPSPSMSAPHAGTSLISIPLLDLALSLHLNLNAIQAMGIWNGRQQALPSSAHRRWVTAWRGSGRALWHWAVPRRWGCSRVQWRDYEA
ncbi:hypothetical protein PVAP13_5KG284300 [Panicum virgatum]|uniref:Uncharacterized protein n=1 Tax=Panicum virgatum TaxID=38727 RepID=A0A8T0SI28_PANVG|nr:hypothetical protein PVAP13_5KG284300 [Panicum virgatum]